MNRTNRIVVLLAAVLATVTAARRVSAQDAPASQYRQVISANPFGLLLNLFNAEYERVVTESTTAGIGGSAYFANNNNSDPYSSGNDKYVNADAFLRYYPNGTPLRGWAFGAKLGVTSVTGEGSYFGYGFDLNRSWLLGKKNNFYVGVGFGLKKLVGVPDLNSNGNSFGLKYIPTFRIVNVGFAF